MGKFLRNVSCVSVVLCFDKNKGDVLSAHKGLKVLLGEKMIKTHDKSIYFFFSSETGPCSGAQAGAQCCYHCSL